MINHLHCFSSLFNRAERDSMKPEPRQRRHHKARSQLRAFVFRGMSDSWDRTNAPASQHQVLWAFAFLNIDREIFPKRPSGGTMPTAQGRVS